MIIGISGKIGHGKDVIAGYLVREHGFKIVRMSDALKQELCERLPRTLQAIAHLNGIPDQDNMTLVSLLKPKGIRELLQEYGTEVRRADDPAYWVNRWAETARMYKDVVVPDVRFLNEARAVQIAGGVLWRVRRPNYKDAPTDHSSEQFVDDFGGFDRTFINDNTIGGLEANVEYALQQEEYGFTLMRGAA